MTREEMLLKAKEAKSAEELLALAKEKGMEMTEASAKAYFEQIHKTGELADDELDHVAGGGCYHDGNLVVTPLTLACDDWRCDKCGSECEWIEMDATINIVPICKNRLNHDEKFIFRSYCSNCKYYKYEDALCLCTYHRR